MADELKGRQGVPLALGDMVAIATLSYKSASLRFGEITEIVLARTKVIKRKYSKRWDYAARTMVREKHDVEETQRPGIKVTYGQRWTDSKHSVWRLADKANHVDAIKAQRVTPDIEESAADE